MTSPRSTTTKAKPSYVLGLDPGLARFGWAVVETLPSPRLVAAGCITTSSDLATPKRLLQLSTQLNKIIKTHRPAQMVLEEIFFSKNVSTAMAVGQARGIALLSAATVSLRVVELTPTAIKASVTGYGRADKAQVARMVVRLLKLKKAPRYDDTADAMAAALCGTPERMVR